MFYLPKAPKKQNIKASFFKRTGQKVLFAEGVPARHFFKAVDTLVHT
jgi:hypothetical protein